MCRLRRRSMATRGRPSKAGRQDWKHRSQMYAVKTFHKFMFRVEKPGEQITNIEIGIYKMQAEKQKKPYEY